MGKTMSEEAIRLWLKKVKYHLECESKPRNNFEKKINSLLRKFKIERNFEINPEEMATNRIFPHEFLFLIINGKSRLNCLQTEAPPPLTTNKVSIKVYEMEEIDAARLDYIYELDVNEMMNQKNPMVKM